MSRRAPAEQQHTPTASQRAGRWSDIRFSSRLSGVAGHATLDSKAQGAPAAEVSVAPEAVGLRLHLR